MMFPQPNDPYSSFFPLSPPTLSYGDLHDIILSSSSTTSNNFPQTLPPPPPPPPRKDRHRKIDTAKGPRDRRMRLSLDVARKFFDLQDLLAFDKASKTVQWLLNKSKAAIKAHVAASKGKAMASDQCEERISTVENKAPKMSRSTRNVAVRKRGTNTLVKPKVARECRDKARARARERTLEKKNKKMMMMMECCRQDEVSKEMIEEMENDGNESIAIFYYDEGMENLLEDPWEMSLTENMDDRVLLNEFPVEMSYGESSIIQPVFDHM